MPALTVHPTNTRYVSADGGVTPFLLSGSHTWCNVIDIGGSGFPPAAHDWQGYARAQAAAGQTFTRLWAGELTRSFWFYPTTDYSAPLPYARTGPGNAADGGLKFDLTQFDSDYFDRLRERIQFYETLGMYCGVMLFNNPLAGTTSWDTEGHPYTSTNNINGITGQTANLMQDCYRLATQPTGVLARQEAYVEHVLDTVEDLPNVILEIINELAATTESHNWQAYWISKIRTYEAANSTYEHLVWRSPEGGQGADDSATVLATSAEIISPDIDWTGYSPETAVAEHAFDQVSILDTDHTYGFSGGLPDTAWKAFTRGHNFAYMQDYFGILSGGPFDRTGVNPNAATHAACGHIVAYSKRVNLTTCIPNGALASTGYCLATPGTDYLVYQPGTAAFTVNLSSGSGVGFRVEWFNTNTGAVSQKHEIQGGSASESFTSPFTGVSGVVLLLTRASRPESVGNRYGRGWR